LYHSDENIDDYFAIACEFALINSMICIKLLKFLSKYKPCFKGTINKKTKLGLLQKFLNIENYDVNTMVHILNFEFSGLFDDIAFLLLKNGSFDVLLEQQKRSNYPNELDIIMDSIMMRCPKIIRVMTGYYIILYIYVVNSQQFIIESLINNLLKKINSLNEYFLARSGL
jgi:hypothetical protein